jgi:hypothetical protein
VPRHHEHRLVVPKRALKVVAPPQSLTELPREVIPGKLFCTPDEPETVRGFRLPFDEQVQVIRHEAVGIYCNAIVVSCSHNLLQHRVDSGLLNE